MPFPGVFDYRSDITELRPPCCRLPEFFRRGDKDGRVSGTTRRFFNRKVTAGHFFSRPDHFPNGKPVLRTQIKGL